MICLPTCDRPACYIIPFCIPLKTTHFVERTDLVTLHVRPSFYLHLGRTKKLFSYVRVCIQSCPLKTEMSVWMCVRAQNSNVLETLKKITGAIIERLQHIVVLSICLTPPWEGIHFKTAVSCDKVSCEDCVLVCLVYVSLHKPDFSHLLLKITYCCRSGHPEIHLQCSFVLPSSFVNVCRWTLIVSSVYWWQANSSKTQRLLPSPTSSFQPAACWK